MKGKFMPQKKQIIDISIRPSENGWVCPVIHDVNLTYSDNTKMTISMNGDQLANILGKEYVDLILNGSSYSGFTFTAGIDVNGRLRSRGTLSIKDMLALFNESDYVKAITQKQ